MGKTSIEWTDVTWNPTRGCSRVSEGCRHCYAEQQAARIVRMGKGKPTAYDGLVTDVQKRQIQLLNGEPTGHFRTVTEARWTGEVRLVADNLATPLGWKKPRRVFVNSMSDLFHEKLSNEQIAAVFGVMAACPQHTFQVLTKRASRMREWFAWMNSHPVEPGRGHGNIHPIGICAAAATAAGCPVTVAGLYEQRGGGTAPWPFPNVWLGVSVENQAAADERIPELLATPAAVRFLSCEPLLGLVDVAFGLHRCALHPSHTGVATKLDWVIAGCESGPRPCDVAWLRSLRDQCAAADVPYFLKQAKYAVDTRGVVCIGDGSHETPGGVISLPYLDGMQHAAFPVPST